MPGVIAEGGGVPIEAGGRVRTGMVFRLSGGLAGPEELHELEAAGLRLVVDLRGDGEDRAVIEDWARAGGVRYVSEAITAASPEQVAEAVRRSASEAEALEHVRSIYRTIVDDYGTEVASTIGALAHELPAGYGCAAGKDRTGVVTALLHVLLGVSEAEAARSYVASAPSIDRLRPLAREYLGLADGDPIPPGLDVLMGVREATILESLEHIRNDYGGVPAYLERHGLPAESVAELRRRLVE